MGWRSAEQTRTRQAVGASDAQDWRVRSREDQERPWWTMPGGAGATMSVWFGEGQSWPGLRLGGRPPGEVTAGASALPSHGRLVTMGFSPVGSTTSWQCRAEWTQTWVLALLLTCKTGPRRREGPWGGEGS